MTTITYKVTVATGTTQYGTGNRFYINGELAPVLYLQEGNTYIFDQSDSTLNLCNSVQIQPRYKGSLSHV